jgi:hypothetical protein
MAPFVDATDRMPGDASDDMAQTGLVIAAIQFGNTVPAEVAAPTASSSASIRCDTVPGEIFDAVAVLRKCLCCTIFANVSSR